MAPFEIFLSEGVGPIKVIAEKLTSEPCAAPEERRMAISENLETSFEEINRSDDEAYIPFKQRKRGISKTESFTLVTPKVTFLGT